MKYILVIFLLVAIPVYARSPSPIMILVAQADAVLVVSVRIHYYDKWESYSYTDAKDLITKTINGAPLNARARKRSIGVRVLGDMKFSLDDLFSGVSAESYEVVYYERGIRGEHARSVIDDAVSGRKQIPSGNNKKEPNQ